MNKTIILIGGGGHAKVLCDMLRDQGNRIEAVFAPSIDEDFSLFHNITRISDDSKVFEYDPDEILLINGVGGLPGSSLRSSIFRRFKERSFQFLTIKSKLAFVSEHAKLGMGVQIMPGAVVNANAVIGDNSIINSGAIVEHDCRVGDNNHIAPGAVLCGESSTESNVHVGVGAAVIQGIHIGENSVVGAGTSVTRNLEANMVCRPAPIIKRPA